MTLTTQPSNDETPATTERKWMKGEEEREGDDVRRRTRGEEGKEGRREESVETQRHTVRASCKHEQQQQRTISGRA